jgi:hypothetical protein
MKTTAIWKIRDDDITAKKWRRAEPGAPPESF